MSDERQEPPAGEQDDSTRPLPPSDDRAGGPEPVDRTQRLPGPTDRTAEQPPEPAAPDRTAPLPPTGRPGPAAWSGRAEVPPPRPADYQPGGGEWYAEDSGRRWWLPILWGVVVLLLLALLGAGLWLAIQSADDGTEPGPTPSVSPTRTVPTTPAPTTAEPTTRSPSPSPTSEPVEVPVPPLVGLSQEAAEAILARLGVNHRVEYRASDRPAGTVIDTDPAAGEPVPAGEEVTLTVSRGRPTPTASPSEPTTEPTPTA
ncbi:PASTA domain-containing protein [Micromonospora echinaurantiaca]|uniref:PASTA domain-containing protein n=1 Tax=Micromonospora echinaurantiaca TaxID=47857 RepID=UPI0037B0A5B1